MLVITYAIRADAQARGYDDWLRRVDNPFFNAAAGMAHYSNWVVAGGSNPFAPNTHFDFVGMDSMASLDQVWNDPELNRFRKEWRRLWGVTDGDPAASIQTCLCERRHATAMEWSDRLAFLPAASDAMAGWDTWRAIRTLRGTGIGFDRFHVRFLGAQDEFERLGAAAGGAVFATCIASPS